VSRIIAHRAAGPAGHPPGAGLALGSPAAGGGEPPGGPGVRHRGQHSRPDGPVAPC
jgi:hypothetical protein